jgi:hypothetical protein
MTEISRGRGYNIDEKWKLGSSMQVGNERQGEMVEAVEHAVSGANARSTQAKQLHGRKDASATATHLDIHTTLCGFALHQRRHGTQTAPHNYRVPHAMGLATDISYFHLGGLCPGDPFHGPFHEHAMASTRLYYVPGFGRMPPPTTPLHAAAASPLLPPPLRLPRRLPAGPS